VSRARFALGVPVAMAADLALFSMLRRARPRPFGLAGIPQARPAMLSSAGGSGGRGVTNVVLSYGRPLTVTGPLTEVETCFSEAECYLPALEETITRAQLRDQAWARQDWESEPDVFGPVPQVRVQPDGFEHRERVVLAAGQERRLPVASHGRHEALRFVHDSLVVTAVARTGFPERPAFDLVEDLEPYLAEHRRFILSWLRFWES
jgi:hypothetical protein